MTDAHVGPGRAVRRRLRQHQLYESLGDAEALATIGRCVTLMSTVCAGHGGRVVKTIGDEAMAVFASADKAARSRGGNAGADFRARRRSAARAWRFASAFTWGRRSKPRRRCLRRLRQRRVADGGAGQARTDHPSSHTVAALAPWLRDARPRSRHAVGQGQVAGHRHLRAALAGRRGGPDGGRDALEAAAGAHRAAPWRRRRRVLDEPRRRSRWAATRRTTS